MLSISAFKGFINPKILCRENLGKMLWDKCSGKNGDRIKLTRPTSDQEDRGDQEDRDLANKRIVSLDNTESLRTGRQRISIKGVILTKR